MRFLDTSNWSDHVIKEAVQIAGKLDEQYANDHIIAVGQSPAWILHCITEIRKAEGRAPNTAAIAFSGRFFTHDYGWGDDRYDNYTYTGTDNYPPSKNLSAYFSYLSEQQETATDVIQRYEETGQRSVFLDFAESGQGFASFIHIWMNASQIAQNQGAKDMQAVLNHAAIFHVLRSTVQRTPPAQYQMRRSADDTSPQIFKITHDPACDNHVLVNMAGAQGEEGGFMGSDRLVPSFDVSASGKCRLLPTENESRAAAIKRKFEPHIRQYHLKKSAAKQTI